jgi:hypothetical protein
MVLNFYKNDIKRKNENVIKSLRPFFSTATQAGTRRTVVIVDNGDYATWVVVSVDCLLESKDPPHRLAGLEEVEALAPAISHITKWPLLATGHNDNLGLFG